MQKNQMGRTLLETIAVVVIMTIISLSVYEIFRLTTDKASVRNLTQEITTRVIQMRHQALTASGIHDGVTITTSGLRLPIKTVQTQDDKNEGVFKLIVGAGDFPLEKSLCEGAVKKFSTNDQSCFKEGGCSEASGIEGAISDASGAFVFYTFCKGGTESNPINSGGACGSNHYEGSNGCEPCPAAPSCGGNSCCELKGPVDVCGRYTAKNKPNESPCTAASGLSGTCQSGTCVASSSSCPATPSCGSNPCCELTGPVDTCGRPTAKNKPNDSPCTAASGLSGTCQSGTCVASSSPSCASHASKVGGICKCHAGYYGNGTTSCTACPAGTYSGTVGATSNTTCTSCPAGTYSGTPGATSSSTCRTCGHRQWSGSGASSCQTCEESYRSNSGHTGCENCSEEEYQSLLASDSICYPTMICAECTQYHDCGWCLSCGAAQSYIDYTYQTSEMTWEGKGGCCAEITDSYCPISPESLSIYEENISRSCVPTCTACNAEGKCICNSDSDCSNGLGSCTSDYCYCSGKSGSGRGICKNVTGRVFQVNTHTFRQGPAGFADLSGDTSTKINTLFDVAARYCAAHGERLATAEDLEPVGATSYLVNYDTYTITEFNNSTVYMILGNDKLYVHGNSNWYYYYYGNGQDIQDKSYPTSYITQFITPLCFVE